MQEYEPCSAQSRPDDFQLHSLQRAKSHGSQRGRFKGQWAPPESITALDPSHTAFATSEASARVGIPLLILRRIQMHTNKLTTSSHCLHHLCRSDSKHVLSSSCCDHSLLCIRYTINAKFHAYTNSIDRWDCFSTASAPRSPRATMMAPESSRIPSRFRSA